MSKGIRLFRVLGIQISIDYTWFIVFVLFAWSLSYGYFPFKHPGLERSLYLLMGVVSAILLFACVLIHELSHSYTSNRLGLEIREITLFIFGGVAQLTKEPEKASTELKIALAGPAASAVLAVVFYALSKMLDSSYPIINAILSYLALVNTVLLVFNMIPGFPLDGGRVLRAIWWARTGDIERSTRIATNIGKAFAFFLIISGAFQIFTGNFTGGLWSVLIGVFVQQAAESSYRQVLMRKALQGVKVRDIMTKGVITVGGDITIAEAVDGYFFKYHHASFPVVSGTNVTGLLTLKNVRDLDREKWRTTSVKDVMRSLGPEDVLSPEDDAMTALQRLMRSDEGPGRFPVIDRGELVGIISQRDVIKMLEFKAGLER